jgi:hypothetical protein
MVCELVEVSIVASSFGREMTDQDEGTAFPPSGGEEPLVKWLSLSESRYCRRSASRPWLAAAVLCEGVCD